MRTTPGWPLRNTSASPSITRAVTPHPAAHSGHTLGFHTAMPGVISSSGMKRTIWFSGLPQPARAAVVPVMAVTLRKRRRSIGGDVMTADLMRTQ